MPVLVKLYSANNLSNMIEALDAVVAAGYDGVEGCSLNFEDPAMFRLELERRGLAMPQAHVPLEMLEDEFDEAVTIARTLGVYTVIAPWLDEADRPRLPHEWERLGERLNAIEGKLRALGLRFAWHNHEFELARLADGRTPMGILLATAPGMDWEVDLGWVVRAGEDPVEWLNRHGERVVAVHLKDLQANHEHGEESGWADLGFGMIDWVPIFAVLRKLPRLSSWITEHDDPSDFQRFVSRSKIAFDRLHSTRSDQTFEGFTHVAIKVLDLDRQLAFYEGVMGFREMFRLPSEDGTVFLVYLRVNDRQYLELFPHAQGDGPPGPDARGYQHICLEVADLDTTVATLRHRGARMCLWHADLSGVYEVDEDAITLGRDGNRQSWVKDPEGNRIELMELALNGMQYKTVAERLSTKNKQRRDRRTVLRQAKY